MRQKTRSNCNISWVTGAGEKKYGTIQLFVQAENSIMSLARELLPHSPQPRFLTNPVIRFDSMHIMVRDSYCYSLVPENAIRNKIVRIADFIYEQEYCAKK